MICSECGQGIRCSVCCTDAAEKVSWIRGIKIFRCVLCHDGNIVPIDVLIGICCELGLKAAFEELGDEIEATEDYYSEGSNRLSIQHEVERNYQEHAMRGDPAS